MEVKEQKIIIRQALPNEVDMLLRIETGAWREKAATREMLLSRIEVFPEGVFCAIKEGQIQGFAVNEIIDLNKFDQNNLSWTLLTDNGFLRKSHDYRGNSLYGVSISVPSYVSNKNVAQKLYEYGAKLAVGFNLNKIYVGSRIPSFHKYADRLTVEEYVYKKTATGRILDPELALYVKMGMKIERIIPNYFNDPESLNYGVLVSWANPFYPFTKHLKFLAKVVSTLFKI